MCGIAGSCPARPDFVTRAVTEVRRRGPDSSGTARTAAGMLGVARLSITDHVHGDQPISNRTGDLHIVFNGAIYNADDLIATHRLEVESGNDAEVALALFERLGCSFTDQIDGMYAFIILGEREGRFWYGVDELGIKPLYSAKDGDTSLYLASTAQALGSTLLSRAERVTPGTVQSASGLEHETVNRAPVTNWRNDLATSVRSQIPKEVAWGCLLSGGLDSSVLVTLARGFARRPLRTLSCGLPMSVDVLHARRVADHLETEHHERLLDPDEIPNLVREVIDATGSFEPWLVLGGIGTLAVCQEASRLGLKVLLSGEGADELFAGYADFDETPADQLEAQLRAQQLQLGATECLRLDRCSMHAGVEVRVPYLSRRVVNAVRRLPVSEKRDLPGSRDSTTKVALRRHARALGLPEWVASRAKEGFSTGTGVLPVVHEAALSERNLWAASRYRARFAAPGLDMNSPVGAWLLGLWLERFGDSFGADWDSLACRGLVRNSSSSAGSTPRQVQPADPPAPR